VNSGWKGTMTRARHTRDGRLGQSVSRTNRGGQYQLAVLAIGFPFCPISCQKHRACDAEFSGRLLDKRRRCHG
jgi:hypothetical protein